MPISMFCPMCGEEIRGIPDKFSGKMGHCPYCKNDIQIATKPIPITEPQRRSQRGILSGKAAVILTTTVSLEGYEILEYLGIESVEYVIGTGVLSDLNSGLQDLTGSRSTSFEQKLGDAKSEVLRQLQVRAVERGGNAVVGVDLDYATFTSNRMAIVVSGTVVKVGKLARSEFPNR